MWRFLSIITFNNFVYALNTGNGSAYYILCLTALPLLCFLAGLMTVRPVCQNSESSPDTGIVIIHFRHAYVCEELYIHIYIYIYIYITFLHVIIQCLLNLQRQFWQCLLWMWMICFLYFIFMGSGNITQCHSVYVSVLFVLDCV